MALRINTNISSISAQRHLGKTDRRLTHAMQALSSGNRIVESSDDAAGLAISENLRAQLGGYKQARNNAENAKSLIQVAEGAMAEQNNILIRMRELGVQAASDTLSDDEREFINLEFTQLRDELDRIAKTTTFGNRKLLEGSGEQFEFQVGIYGSEDNRIRFSLNADATAESLGIEDLEITDKSSARDSLSDVDQALNKMARMRADFGAVQSRLQKATNNLEISYEKISAAKSRIADADIAHEAAEIAAAQVAQEAGTSVLAQANAMPMMAARLISG